jgi:hypothetical protein
MLPKCPLCIAALLSALGLGGAVTSVIAPLARPLTLVVAVAGALAVVWTLRRPKRKRDPGIEPQRTCCAH